MISETDKYYILLFLLHIYIYNAPWLGWEPTILLYFLYNDSLFYSIHPSSDDNWQSMW